MLLQNKTFQFLSLFSLLILLIIPNIFYYLYYGNVLVSVFINNLVLVFFIALCSKFNFTKFIGIFFLCFLVLNNGLAIFSLFFYKEPFNVVTALSFFTTNLREATEMLISFWFVIIPVLLYFIVFYFLLLKVISKKIGVKLFLFGFCVLLIYPAKLSYNTYHSDSLNKLGNLSSYTKYTMLANSPFYTLASFYSAKEYLQSIKELDSYDFSYPIFSLEQNNLDNIIVVLGESARRDALHLYGNLEPTTPFIEERLSNLLVYNKAVAPSSHTNSAVTLMLSKQIPSNKFNVSGNRDNIIELANATKVWDTYWISTQEQVGVFENMYSTINRKSKYQDWLSTSEYDGELLPKYDKIFLDNNVKRLIFIHIKGSHSVVSKRYPKDFDVFAKSDKNYINEYNNSILYTDYVLNEIIKKVENTKSIVIYVSDHGQSIVEGGFKHSNTKKGVDVPFFIWHSDLVDESLKKVGRIEEPISTTNLYNIVSDYMGIKGLDPKDSNKELKVLTPSIDMTYYKDLPDGE